MRRVLARRDMRLYVVGQTLSLFGDTALWLALAVWAKSLTGSSARGRDGASSASPRRACSRRCPGCSPTACGGARC